MKVVETTVKEFKPYKVSIKTEGEDFISDYVTGLNISQELKEYTRIKRKEQRRKMIEAINKERESD